MAESNTYYSIKEISTLLDEEQHVLRYWEREFPELQPKKNTLGNRIYSEDDLVLLKTLKHLLREKRQTVQEVKKILTQQLQLKNVPLDIQDTHHSIDTTELEDISKQLEKIIDQLRS